MASIPLDDILEFEAAFEKTITVLASYVKDVLPNHEIIRADRDLSVPTVPYVTIRPVMGGGMNASSYGNDPIYTDYGDDETITYVFQYLCPVMIKCYKGNAFSDAMKLKQGFKNKARHYKFFKSDPTVGVTTFTQVRNDPTPIDQQTMETGAIFNVSLSFLSKEVETESLGYVQKVEGLTFTKETDSTPIVGSGFDTENQTP